MIRCQMTQQEFEEYHYNLIKIWEDFLGFSPGEDSSYPEYMYTDGNNRSIFWAAEGVTAWKGSPITVQWEIYSTPCLQVI